MNISGVLVHAHPRQAESVREQLVKIPGVEVHAISPEGRIVVTVETGSTGEMADTVLMCQNTKGVLSASMIYHHDEDISDDDEFTETVTTSNIETDQGQDWSVQEASK
ncbi:MAG: chaperone NapD [Gammaproteobacteria bacterium]|nr:chaperone NapD [Gammaproteobacteria bacterium]